MMRLLLDLGNSSLCYRLIGDKKSPQEGRILVQAGLTDGLARLGAALGNHSPVSIFLASVRGQREHADIIQWSSDRFGITPRLIEVRDDHNGFKLAYRNPARLGVDRWLGMLAVRDATAGRSALLCSSGSAFTLDALNERGNHIGGIIVPGMLAMQRCLAKSTQIDFEPGQLRDALPDLGRTTEQCIRVGALASQLGLIQHYSRLLQNARGYCPEIWLTGGDAPALAGAIEGPVTLRDNLVLDGLEYISAN